MAYTLSNLGGADPTVETINQMERKEFSQKEQKTPVRPKAQNKVSNLVIYNAANIEESTPEDILSVYNTTPKANRVKTGLDRTPKNRLGTGSSPRTIFSPSSFSPALATPSSKYASRTNSGDAVCSFGDTATAKWHPTSPGFCPTIRFVTPVAPDVHYMFEQLRDKASVLDEIIEHIGEQIVTKCSLDDPEDVKTLQPEPFITVGRICCDANGRLNSRSVLLECSRDLSTGSTVPVDLTQVPQYSLFPGQIVALRATNPTRSVAVGQQVYSNAVLPLPVNRPTLAGSNGPLEMVIAAGPYTPSSTLTYQPLEDLMEYLKKHEPHLIVLIGPFVDSMHTQVQEGSFAETFNAFFEKLVDGIMVQLKDSNTQIVIVPSWRDAHHHMVYPTPPFHMNKKYNNLHLASDPCMLDIDGLMVGITSADILLHLGKEEISQPAQGADRLGRLASHILSQQCFYPLYPPAEDMPLDLTLLEQYGHLGFTPHILVLPSDLRYFIKELFGCVVINPERLAKGMVGGSFARLEISPPLSDNWSASNICGQVIKI
ncbi:DNA polymerase alpha subunit B isoform X2 [Anabrus simplex]